MRSLSKTSMTFCRLTPRQLLSLPRDRTIPQLRTCVLAAPALQSAELDVCDVFFAQTFFCKKLHLI